MSEFQRSESEPSGARTTVLVVDDEEPFQDSIRRYLGDYRVLHAFNGRQAMRELGRHHVDVVLLDLNMPGKNGFEVLADIQREYEAVEVIVVTAYAVLPGAVRAVKQGAFDFVEKSHESYKRLAEHIERALEHRRRKREHLDAKTREQWLRDAYRVMEESRSRAFRSIMKLANRVAPTPFTVLLEGESGVGKEVMARYLHARSDRADRPFVVVNLGAVPTSLLDSHLFGHVKGAFTGADKTHLGKFEIADGGTLFLDEVGELPRNVQVKLLRVLQEREVERLGAQESSPVDVRLIAATNRTLRDEVLAQRFREDLFYRLDVVKIRIPSLRERPEDLPALIELLSEKHSRSLGSGHLRLGKDATSILEQYPWPGNVRELENLIMRLVAVNPGKLVGADDIPLDYCLESLHELAGQVLEENEPGTGERALYRLARKQFERYLVRLMVGRCGGDKRAAARVLGISYSLVKEKTSEKQ